jgi:hypothetical protein
MIIGTERMLKVLVADVGPLVFAVTMVLVVLPVAGLIIHMILEWLDRPRGSK